MEKAILNSTALLDILEEIGTVKHGLYELKEPITFVFFKEILIKKLPFPVEEQSDTDKKYKIAVRKTEDGGDWDVAVTDGVEKVTLTIGADSVYLGMNRWGYIFSKNKNGNVYIERVAFSHCGDVYPPLPQKVIISYKMGEKYFALECSLQEIKKENDRLTEKIAELKQKNKNFKEKCNIPKIKEELINTIKKEIEEGYFTGLLKCPITSYKFLKKAAVKMLEETWVNIRRFE